MLSISVLGGIHTALFDHAFPLLYFYVEACGAPSPDAFHSLFHPKAWNAGGVISGCCYEHGCVESVIGLNDLSNFGHGDGKTYVKAP